MGPSDKMTPQAADALFKKFEVPLTNEDIDVIARLTNLNVDAPRMIAAGMIGPDGAASMTV